MMLFGGGHRKLLCAFLVGITVFSSGRTMFPGPGKMARKCTGPRTLQSWVPVGLHEYPAKKEALAIKRKCGSLVVKKHDF